MVFSEKLYQHLTQTHIDTHFQALDWGQGSLWQVKGRIEGAKGIVTSLEDPQCQLNWTPQSSQRPSY